MAETTLHQIAEQEVENRPKFWRWCRDPDSRRDVATVFGRTPEWVRLITLPFDDAKRRRPSADDVARIHRWTGGQVGPADWYPPELSSGGDVSPAQVEGTA